MGFVVTSDSLKKTLDRITKAKETIHDAIVDALADVGEYLTEQIRNGNLSEWLNDTGNLRSSIGYAVGKRGKTVRISDFDVVLDGSEGSQRGKELAEKLVDDYSSYDYTLILVAGEEYAVYVEAIENKIVLSSGLLYIQKELIGILRERINEALQRI